MNVTASQLQIMRHTLGYDDAGYLRSDSAGEYRNYFVSGYDADLRALCDAGLMRDCGMTFTHGERCFRVTDAGRLVIQEHKPSRPRFTPAQQRYRDFLNWKDATQGTFRQYLAYLKEAAHHAA